MKTMNKIAVGLGLVGLLAQVGCSGGADTPSKLVAAVQPAPVKKHLNFVTKEGLTYDLKLDCYPNGVVIDDVVFYSVLRFHEASPINQYPVTDGDSFVLTDSTHQFTRILLYNGFDAANKLLSFDDWATTGTRFAAYDPVRQRADIVVSGVLYEIHGDKSSPQEIAIDQNGDSVFDGTEAPIVDLNGTVIHEKDLTQ